MDSLYFPSMFMREESIKEAHKVRLNGFLPASGRNSRKFSIQCWVNGSVVQIHCFGSLVRLGPGSQRLWNWSFATHCFLSTWTLGRRHISVSKQASFSSIRDLTHYKDPRKGCLEACCTRSFRKEVSWFRGSSLTSGRTTSSKAPQWKRNGPGTNFSGVSKGFWSFVMEPCGFSSALMGWMSTKDYQSQVPTTMPFSTRMNTP